MDKIDKFAKHPKKSLRKLAYPVMIAMLVQTLYNVVDTAFVGRLGAEAIAGLTFSFPIFFFLMSLNAGIGIGTSSLISRRFGAKQYDAADNASWHGLFISLIMALAMFLSWPLLKNAFVLMGATGLALTYSIEYMLVIMVGLFFLFPGSVFMNIFTGQGDTKTAMTVQVLALILNIILDPIFIYVLDMGVKGAAIATVVSFSFALLLSLYFIKTRTKTKLLWSNFEFHIAKVKDIFTVGLPASLMMMLTSVYILFINKFMAFFSVNHVAAFGLTSRLHSLVLTPIFAFAIASMTMSGMFFGAKRYDLVRSTIFYSLRIGMISTSIIGALLFVFAKYVLQIFSNDPLLLSLGAQYLRVEVFAFPLLAGAIIISRSLQGMGFGLPSLIISIARIILVAIPLSWVFIYVLGYSYLWVAVASVAGGFAANIIAFIWLFAKLK